MQFLRLVDPYNNFSKRLAIVLSLEGLILTLNFLYWSASVSGFDAGYHVGKVSYSADLPEESEQVHFSDGGGGYARLADDYSILCILAIGFTLSCIVSVHPRVADFKYVFAAINITVLVWIIWLLLWLLGLKDPEMNESLDTLFNNLGVRTAIYDRSALGFSSLLIVLQLLFLIMGFLKERTLPRRISSI